MVYLDPIVIYYCNPAGAKKSYCIYIMYRCVNEYGLAFLTISSIHYSLRDVTIRMQEFNLNSLEK